MTVKTKAWISGHCGQGNPEHIHKQCDEHPRADGVPCACWCHWEPQAEPTSWNPDAPTGLHYDLDELVYHSHPTSLSVTGAKLLLKAPALFHYRRTHPEQNRTFDYGHAAHARVLGVGAEIVVIQRDGEDATDLRSKAAQAHVEEIRAAGKTPLLRAELARVDEMAEALADVPLVQQLMRNGQPEVSAFCVDEPTGVMRRSRVDMLDELLIDYKTTVDAEPSAFARQAAKYGYHQQAAWYEEIIRDLGRPVRGFLFIAQEKTAPYLTSVTELTADAVARGAELNRRALERYRDCTEAGRWPGYGDQIVPIDLPKYAYYNQQEPA